MNSVQNPNPAPIIWFWTFKLGINRYHANRALYHFIHKFEFVNLFKIKIYHSYLREEIDADQRYFCSGCSENILLYQSRRRL